MKQIAAALVAVQGALKSAIKDSENAAFKNGAKVSKYADLTAVWDVCRKPLSENGLCVIQTTDFDDTGAWLKTTLLHTSGESIEGRFPLRPTKPDMQGMGSALTYARRYGLSAIVGIVADIDDDGNAASGVGSRAIESSPISATQTDKILGLISETGADKAKFCKYMGVSTVEDIPASSFERAMSALQSKKEKAV